MYFKQISTKECGYKSFVISSSDLTEIRKTYKAIQVEIKEEKEDKDGRYIEEKSITEYSTIFKGKDLKLRDLFSTKSTKSKIIYISDDGRRLTVNGNKYHDRMFFDCEFNVDDAAFDINTIREEIKLEYSVRT